MVGQAHFLALLPQPSAMWWGRTVQLHSSVDPSLPPGSRVTSVCTHAVQDHTVGGAKHLPWLKAAML